MRLFSSIAALSLFSLCGFGQNVDLLGYLDYPVRASNVWGFTDSLGKEYALVGLQTGTSIVDITTDSTHPTEVLFVPGPSSIWREIKTWNHHAYITNETGNGVQIIDLSNLPNSVDTSWYSIDAINDDTLRTAHTLFIDENGFAYIFGSNLGAYILDLNANPGSPVFAGKYTFHYVHDGFVRGDTMWTSEIGDGLLQAVDVSDKSNPVVIGSVSTPRFFTHNCWLSDDGQYAFTTDERSGAPVASFDVSDVTDMKKLDELYSHRGSGVIPHNTYWLNGYLITSWYKDGVVMADANKPDNMVITGWYDTSPFPSEDGFSGCWGVYPFFPSGKIAASDIQEGLFVLRPQYKRGCYLEGTATDISTSLGIPGARVELVNTTAFDSTTITGDYKTGIADSGLYDVRFSHPNCQTMIVQDVMLQSGQVTSLNVLMDCLAVGTTDLDQNPLLWFDHSTQKLHYRLIGDHLVLTVLTADGRTVLSRDLDAANQAILLGPQLPSATYLAILAGPSSIQTLRFALVQ